MNVDRSIQLKKILNDSLNKFNASLINTVLDVGLEQSKLPNKEEVFRDLKAAWISKLSEKLSIPLPNALTNELTSSERAFPKFDGVPKVLEPLNLSDSRTSFGKPLHKIETLSSQNLPKVKKRKSELIEISNIEEQSESTVTLFKKRSKRPLPISIPALFPFDPIMGLKVYIHLKLLNKVDPLQYQRIFEGQYSSKAIISGRIIQIMKTTDQAHVRKITMIIIKLNQGKEWKCVWPNAAVTLTKEEAKEAFGSFSRQLEPCNNNTNDNNNNNSQNDSTTQSSSLNSNLLSNNLSDSLPTTLLSDSSHDILSTNPSLLQDEEKIEETNIISNESQFTPPQVLQEIYSDFIITEEDFADELFGSSSFNNHLDNNTSKPQQQYHQQHQIMMEYLQPTHLLFLSHNDHLIAGSSNMNILDNHHSTNHHHHSTHSNMLKLSTGECIPNDSYQEMEAYYQRLQIQLQSHPLKVILDYPQDEKNKENIIDLTADKDTDNNDDNNNNNNNKDNHTPHRHDEFDYLNYHSEEDPLLLLPDPDIIIVGRAVKVK
jgi:hypothetical protein